MKIAQALLVLFVLCSLVQAQKRTLVVLDDHAIEATHSMFFKSLSDRGYQLTFQAAADGVTSFHDYGDYKYDELIIFAPSTESLNKVFLDDVLEFIDSGAGNVLIAADSQASYFITDLVEQFGVELGTPGHSVIDHLAYDASDADGFHTLIVADHFDGAAVLGADSPKPVLFQGNGLSLHADNRLVFPILSASSSAFCGSPEEFLEESTSATGRNLALVAGLQARNNARVAITGSLEMFSDKFFVSDIQTNSGSSQRAGNADFAQELSKWVFGERGMIRIKSSGHHKEGETEQKAGYIINEVFVYTVEVEEFNGSEWVGYECSDLQIELEMIDVYVRKTLTHQGNGVYTTSFRLPDTWGVFSLQLDYHRVGYSSLSEHSLVTILPVRHTDYERYIFSAYPYYASAFAMVGGIALFSLIFLFSK